MAENGADLTSELMVAAADVMAVEGVMVGEQRPFRQPVPVTRRGARQERPDPEEQLLARASVRLRGRLLIPSEQAYDCLATRLRPMDLTPMLRKGRTADEVILLALPGTLPAVQPNVRLAASLFLATILSCLFAGAQMTETVVATGQVNWRIWEGWPFALSMLLILAGHEFSHYFVARRVGAPVSLPYFIPMPLLPFGTLGAVINMPAPPRNRRHLLAIGAAGPLASFLLSLPILWLGLSLSRITPLVPPYAMEGPSLIYIALKFLHFGRLLPSGGFDVMISPVAFAGWAGLWVTALNLIPAGQLDGGHIIHALVGEKWAERILWVVLIGMAALAFLWIGWLLWVGLAFLVSRIRPPLLDDVTQLTTRDRILAVAMLVIFILVFSPIPWSQVGVP